MVAPAAYNDLYLFNTATVAWTALSPSNSPSPRSDFGFAVAPTGMLYLVGGTNIYGGEQNDSKAGAGMGDSQGLAIESDRPGCFSSCPVLRVEVEQGEQTKKKYCYLRAMLFVALVIEDISSPIWQGTLKLLTCAASDCLRNVL